MNNQTDKFFASAYLTLISIIQATAFGIFIFSIDRLIGNGNVLNKLLFLLCEFITIISVTYNYFVGSRDLIWDIDIFDISIPFLLGLGQSLFIIMLGNNSIAHVKGSEFPWFAANLVYIVFASFSLFNAWHKTKKARGYYESKKLIKIYEEHMKQFRWAFDMLPFAITFYMIASLISYCFIGGIILQNIILLMMVALRLNLIRKAFLWDKHICQIKKQLT